MEFPNSPDVDPGPPPNAAPEPPGSGDLTGAVVDSATPAPTPPGTDAASSPQASPAPTPAPAPTAGLETHAATPTSTNLSVGTPGSDLSPPPSSKAFDDDGDAEKERKKPAQTSATFTSALQVAAGYRTPSTPPPYGQDIIQQAKAESPGHCIFPPRFFAVRERFTQGPASGLLDHDIKVNYCVVQEWNGAASHGSRRHGPGAIWLPSRQAASPAPALLEDLECITRHANLRRDGEQRAMTKQEVKTLCRILARHIDVPELPRFLLETHTGFHRDHLGWRLYLILTPGVTFSETNAKYHLLHTLMVSCGDDKQAKELVQKLFQDAHIILCEPKSQIAVFRFVQREVRDFWVEQVFKFNRDKVILQATDSLTSDITGVGYDEGAREILYHIYLRGHHTMRPSDIRMIVQQAVQAPVLTVELVQSTGITEFYDPRWKVTFDMITCPVALEHTRRLVVQLNEKELLIDMHHPRASGRVPCSNCLSVRHSTKNCKNVHAADSIARHSKHISFNTGSGIPKLQDVSSVRHHVQQLQRLHRIAAPSVEERLRTEEAERLAKIEHRAKEVADAAAKAAATEARAQREAEKQAEQDIARRQREKTRAAHALVTKQIRALQQLSKAMQRPSGQATQTSLAGDKAQAAAAAATDTGSTATKVDGNDDESASASGSAENEMDIPMGTADPADATPGQSCPG